MNGNIILLCELHRTDLQYLRTHGSHFKHFFIGDAIEFASRGAQIGVRRIDPVHIRIDFTLAGIQSGGQRHGGRIGPATAERGDAPVFRRALEPGDHEHVVRLKLLMDAGGINGEDAGTAEFIIRDDRDLPAEHRTRLDAGVLEQHAEKRDRGLLARGKQTVHFRQIRLCGPTGRQIQQFVGLPGLGGKHHDYLVSLIQSGFHLTTHHF